MKKLDKLESSSHKWQYPLKFRESFCFTWPELKMLQISGTPDCMSDVFGKRRDEVLYITTILLTNRKDWKKKSYELIHLQDQITCGQNSNEFQSSIHHVDF